MAIVLIFILVLLGLTAVFAKVAEWFQEHKNINIIPAALIDIIAVIIFCLHYEIEDTKDIIWLCVAIVIILVIIVFNMINYGFKNGIFASLAELVFSISATFLVVCVLAVSSQNGKQKRKK